MYGGDVLFFYIYFKKIFLFIYSFIYFSMVAKKEENNKESKIYTKKLRNNV